MRTCGICVTVWLFVGWLVCQGAVPQPPGWQVLFRDDFEDGDAEGWAVWLHEDVARGWLVEKEGNNHVFAGRGSSRAALTVGRWGDFRLAAKIKLVEGSVQLGFRYGEFAGYFVWFHPHGLFISRYQPAHPLPVLAQAPATLSLGRWYLLEVVGVGANIKVYLDGVLKLEYTDAEPWLVGGIALESMSGAYVLVDDIEVSGLPSPPEPLWVKTGGPLGGVGYDVRMHPHNPDLMYVTDTFSGVHISKDGGKTWYASNKGITSRVGRSGDAIPVFCLTIDPHNPVVIWIGTQGTRAIFRSVDGGQTWVQKDKGIVEPFGTAFRGITVDPRDPRVV